MNLNVNDIIESICDSISNRTHYDEPFSSFYMENVFPERIYDGLIHYMPITQQYENFYHADAMKEDGYSSRYRFMLRSDNIDNTFSNVSLYREFWHDIREALISNKVKDKIFNALKKDMRERFEGDLNKIPVTPEPLLYRDTSGYKITPHMDKVTKAVTVQFYLPSNDDHPEYGTSIYKGSRKQGFKEVRRFEFKRNSGYSFAVSEKSWHGVEQINDENLQRDSLMLIYYLPGAKI